MRDYCPTCGVTGDAECHTSTGRDHPARRHYAAGYDAALLDLARRTAASDVVESPDQPEGQRP